MVRNKSDAAPRETESETTREEVESALDGIVKNILRDFGDTKAVPGWHIIFPMGVNVRLVGSEEILTLSDEKAGDLVELATTNPHAFDAASYLAGLHFIADCRGDPNDCPLQLRLFGGQVLLGEIRRPSQLGRPRADDTLLRVWKYSLCRFVAERAPLPLSPNPEKKHDAKLVFTACDAVAAAFSRAGHHETCSQLASLCYDTGHADIRKLAEVIELTDLADI
jgi:hypothetical protein